MTARQLLFHALLLSPLALAQAQEGVKTEICLVPTSVEAAVGDSKNAATAVQDSFTGFLTGPTLGVRPLSAQLESQARQEAKAAGCRYLLFTKVSHHRKQRSALNQALAGAVQQGAWSAVGQAGGGAAAIAANAAAGAASATAAELANSTQNKDQMTLGYRLEAADGTVVIDKSGKRKAESDGEDLLTPLARQASEAVAAAVQ
jgi:hypothetical protein